MGRTEGVFGGARLVADDPEDSDASATTNGPSASALCLCFEIRSRK